MSLSVLDLFFITVPLIYILSDSVISYVDSKTKEQKTSWKQVMGIEPERKVPPTSSIKLPLGIPLSEFVFIEILDEKFFLGLSGVSLFLDWPLINVVANRSMGVV